ncbi:MAG TPA: cyclic nucleotide-binding domain-containing protein, partial [Deltaproteobacteria bacterium]|nr:cyclic nucleotide-binding domain-containing protein [Deltaproteobacteria bacterium]
MKISKKGVGPKDILSRAVALAARGESEQAARSFETCVKAYAQQGLPLRALAAAKAARSALGESPKVQAMLVRLYTELGLAGDAQKEIESGSKLVRKDAIPLLKGLGNDEMTDLLDIMELLPVKKGAYVVRQSEKGEDLYLVAAGTYEVMRDALRVSLMHAGDVFGEIGFFHHAARSASVRAMEDGMLIRLPADELRGLCRKYPALAHALERLYFARVIKKASEDLAINA